MSDFFALPPSEEEPSPPPQRYRRPAWQGPPPATIPAVLPVERVLAQTADVAVTIAALHVYPAGLELELVTFARPDADEATGDGFDPMLFHHHRPRGELSDDVLRIGVQFADGRKATNLTPGWSPSPPEDGGLVLRPGGGGGGGDRYSQSFWLWPLPAEGPVTIVCEWPARGIPVTRSDIDGDAVRAAAGRAQVVFPDDHLPAEPPLDPGAGWAAYVPRG